MALKEIIRDTGSGLDCTEMYQVQVKVLFQLITEECPFSKQRGLPRSPSSRNSNEQTWKQLYLSLLQVLTACRALPTSAPVPEECQTAINLTEAWRRDHTGSYIKPINGNYNCDPGTMIGQGRPWFRFAGDAGNRLMDTCPPRFSCGSIVALWSDDAMPTVIGVNKTITVNGLFNGNCKHYDPQPVRVMKCSDKPYDLVYKYAGNWWCNVGFCGTF